MTISNSMILNPSDDEECLAAAVKTTLIVSAESPSECTSDRQQMQQFQLQPEYSQQQHQAQENRERRNTPPNFPRSISTGSLALERSGSPPHVAALAPRRSKSNCSSMKRKAQKQKPEDAIARMETKFKETRYELECLDEDVHMLKREIAFYKLGLGRKYYLNASTDWLRNKGLISADMR